MKTKIIMLSLLVNMLRLNMLPAQDTLSTDYPYLRKVTVSVKTGHDQSSGMFTYSYDLYNDKDNSGSISDFIVDISRSKNSLALDTIGLKFAGTFSESNFRQRYQEIGNSIVPVSCPSLPHYWINLLGNDLTLTIGKDTLFIEPGQHATEIVMMSKGLPAVRKFLIKPDFNIYEFFPDQEDTTSSMTGYQEDSILAAVNYRSLTVAPASPPFPFIPSEFLDTLSSYVSQAQALNWIKDEAIANRYLGYFSSAKSNLQQMNFAGARATLQTALSDANMDSTSNLTSEAYALIRFNTEYLLAQLPLSPSGFNIKLVNSAGAKLTGGSLQYYDGGWKPAVNNNDGTFVITTTLKTVSLQMTYAYGVQTKSNVAVGSDTVVFQTVNAQVKLQNSQGRLMDTGTVQYYAGAWRNFGTTVNGVATMELLPINYSFRMTYAFGSNDKAQDLSANSTVTFQTTNASVQLKNSQGNLMDTGAVQYYSGAWRTFGTTVNGVASMELLPNNYSFRMTYAYGSNDKAQNIGANSTVIFQTVNAAVQLKNSQGSLIDQGTVQYYSGAWRSFGTTSGGIAMKELLSNSYAFRMTYAFGSNDKTQDVGSNNTVVFSTVLATVNVINAQNNPVNNAVVTYYSGAWRSFDNTVNGNVSKELLPANLQFRAQSGYVLQNKTQDISTNPVVVITLNVGQ